MSKKKDKVCVALLLDRSGSMAVNKIETISAVNSYVEGLKKKFRGRFTLTQFDSESIDIVWDNMKIKNVPELTQMLYEPRSMTPLLDAIGKTANAVKAEGFDNVIFAIVTDGEENHSREYKLDAIRALLEEKRKLGWQIAYIGANVDAFHEAGQLGIAAGQTMNYAGQHATATMDSFLCSNTRYAARSDKNSVGEADFTDEERSAAMGGHSS
jgi:Mg-chelatase subunit ChlD